MIYRFQSQTDTHSIRVIQLDNQPWFVGLDVSRLLGLHTHKGSYAHHYQRMDSDEKKVIKKADLPMSEIGTLLRPLFGYQTPSVTLISESGLYKLIMRSDKPLAKPFQDWVISSQISLILKVAP